MHLNFHWPLLEALVGVTLCSNVQLATRELLTHRWHWDDVLAAAAMDTRHPVIQTPDIASYVNAASLLHQTRPVLLMLMCHDSCASVLIP